ncbi:immunoglobulin superfamily member 10-like [Xiphophorus maculatus]|uniref:Immunoglobulin superfamily member 10-like n=1 Tax=Xiphophorus maculatus TaxID=8083 RepID=A0A3B5REM4_XIPMA|nr:immunoglobulin superfamily member 10-like [Xiphophorus maculatus]XP_023192976.1 immunoglobulin superfamily member 10-like [Xiphophorus maculatus]XP_023192977.1 immunoglobulin superfamily member 10-like [Xiphophorus maculatus]
MHQTGSALLALLALLVLTLEMSSGQSCPRSCNCYQANEVHCTFRSLLIIPPGLPAHTRRINLGFNSISRLHDKSLVGLRRVELLMLHSNNLQHLPDGVFKEMKSLQILKLSYNKLREISSSLTFSGLTSLLRLYLDHNLLQHIHPRALLQLPSLRLLRLQGNRLHQLHPHALCTLSILNTYYFSTLRHLDLSNNSLTILPEKSVTTAPLLETLVLQANPWSCDCRMNWFLSWSLAHPGLLKCPGGPQCPVCASPLSLQGQNLLDQTTLHCMSPIISFPGKETPLESDHSKIQPSEKFREPLGNVTLGLSDQQGYNIDISCKITHSTNSPDIAPPPDLSWSSSSPLPLALSLSLDCPILGQSYEKLWRILAYYSETAARLEREIMLSKAPALAYRYRQAPETYGYYHTGIKASVKARPEWLLQSAISIQLDRAQSNSHKVQLIYSTRVSAHPDPTFNPSLSSPTSHPWVMILTNHTNTAVTAVGIAGTNIQLSCPVLSSSNPSVQWILPDGSKLNNPSSSLDGRFQLSASGLLVQRVQLSDGGLYHCVARAGRDFDVLQLRLAVQESAFPYTGELSGPPVTGTIKDAVTLPCRISGSPEPLASWILPDGNVVWQGLAVSGGLKVYSNGSLSLLTSTLKDTGYYRCIAVNQYGSDTMSMQLILKAQHISTLETSLPRGPQSAAGRSTKIPVTIFRQIDEGSGDEENEEDEKTPTGKRRYPTSLQQRPNRQYLINKSQRYGHVREGHLKRIGGPISPIKQKKHRFQNRPRVTTKKHRIDPQKWADLLAKIRQKTTNSTKSSHSQANAEEKTTTQPIFEEKDEEIRQGEKGDSKDRSISHDLQEKTESEGSSVDDAIVKEEQPQPIQPPDKDVQIIQATQTIAEIYNVTEQPHVNLEIDIKTQTDKENKQTVTTVNPVTETERVTLTSLSGANVIALQSIVLDEKVPNLSSNKTRPQNPLQGHFPNAIPNSRPRKPWDTRRKIGQRRRINRPKIQPVPSPHPHSDPINSVNRAETLNSSPDKITKLLPLSTTTFPPIMLTLGNNVRTIINGVTVTPVSPTVSDPHFITISKFESLPLSPSSTTPHTYTDMMIHSGKKQITESTFNSTPAPTHATIIISEPHVPEPDNRTFTHAAWAHTATQTTLGKHAERPPSKHSKELEMNVLGESHFSITHSLTASSVPSASLTTTSAAQIITTSSAAPKRTSYFSSTKSTPASTTNEDTLPTTTTAAIISPTMSISTPIIIPVSSTPSQTSALSTSMTSTITLPTTSSTISSTLTSDTTFRPIITRLSTTSNPSTSKSSSPVSINAIPKVSISSFSTTSTDSKTTLPATTESILTTTPPSTTKQSTVKTFFSTTTTLELTSTKAITRNTKATGQVDHPANGQNRSQSPTDWKNHGANTIPDSHRSSFHQPSPSLPASPTVPVVRSRPRIADPHNRTMSVPAGSTVNLVCEAQGEPKPSITWTKVATGAVTSIHSRAQRFEVLPNGTLVIQNVQVQDRGTYICSASSLLGRDRLLTTLEIWTRPPHMPYKEVTIHRGGQVHLECQADGVPAPLLSWVLPNRSTLTSSGTFSNRIHMDTNGTLHISVTLPTDQGVYRCVAPNSAGAASASVRLHVSLLPPVIQQPREERLLFSVGWPVYAHCSARGAPTPILRWQIPDGTLVRPSQFLNGNIFVLSNGTLHIHNVGSKDTGNYECTASNAVGTTKRTVTIAVIDGEAKAKKTSNSSFFNKVRTSVIPSQTSTAFSPSKFSPVNPSDRSKNLSISSSPFNSSSSSSLEINKTVKPYPSHFPDIKIANPFSVFSPSTVPTNNTKVSPRGNSTRVASSSHTSGKISTVLQPQPVSPFTKAHIVSTSPSATTVNYEGTLNLYCSVSGNPPPTILWRTPTRKLVDMHYSFDQRVKVHPNGTLSVRAVTEKDSGDYLCIARNKVADDYRILRVSVVTQSPRIDPKHSINQMVSFGKPLKVDCQASGLPHPAVHWKLPNGTTVKSELFQEDNRGQRRHHTVFDNGTLLIPAVGEGDEGEYICYAENQAGQDSMKVIVKAMKTTPPKFTNDRGHNFIKVQQGETATIPCRTTGDPAPTVTWFSPSFIIIPQNLGSGLSSQRVVAISDGTLEVSSAQKIDSGNYTCRASNSAGIRSMVVTLEVETSSSGVIAQVEKGQGWSVKKSDGNHRVITARKINLGSNVVTANKSRSNNSYSDNHSRKVNIVPNTNLNSVFSGSNPMLRSYSQHEFKSPVGGFSTRRGNTGIMAGANEAQNTGIKIDSTGLNRNTPSIKSRSGNVDHSQSTGRGESTERNPEMNNNEVIAGKKSNDAITSRDNSRLTRISTNGQSISGSLSDNGAGTSTQRGHVFNRNSHAGGGNDNRRNSVSSSSNSDTHLGGGKIAKHQAVKGQAVTLPCPYQGYPPIRLVWLLPGNGMLPAPYYGSRLTVHRNGSLEFQDVRVSDGGNLVCVAKTERGDTLMRVQLEVSEPVVDVKSQQGREVENIQQKENLDATQSLPTRTVSLLQHSQRGLGMPDRSHSINSSPSGSVSKPTVSTSTSPLVSTINGETLRLHCPASTTRGSVSWTMPSGKILSRGDSGDLGRYVVQEDGTLIIKQVSVFDRGSYICRFSSHDSSSVSVTTVPVIVIAYPPRITIGPSPVTYTRGGVAVELPCMAIATPRATVSWETPDLTQLRVMGQPRIYGNLYLSPQGSLVIQNPTHRDTGFYRCIAKNVIGVDSKATYLHVM